MKLIFHGGAQEVGKSCIELETGKYRYLFDVGIKFTEHGFETPRVFDVKKIDGVFLSHAHLDHSGVLPLFEHFNLKYPIFTTSQTISLIKILLKDSYKIARIKHLHPAYNKTDLENVRKDIKKIIHDKEYKHKNLKFKFYNAGHIPGSAMIKVETEGKTILYTGDYNINGTPIVKPVNDNYGKIDILITESTYGNRTHPDKEKLKEEFLEHIEKTLARGGSVLIPTFALGRAQDILLMLSEKKWNVPIYYDGMCKKITRKILSTKSKYVRNKETLSRMYNEIITPIAKQYMREKVLKQQGIIITTSGMIQGGPIMYYLKNMWGNEKHSILLMGFQCKRTNGRHLIDEGFVYIDGWKTNVKCEIKKFDFSGHSDSTEIKEFIQKINPKHLIFNHGEPESIRLLVEWAEKNFGGKIYAPKINDVLEF